jgi:hypothetical protein
VRRSDGEEAQELHAQLAAALCSLAEGLLAEAAPAVDAVAEECRALLARAVQADPSSPEPLQVRPRSRNAHPHACAHR